MQPLLALLSPGEDPARHDPLGRSGDVAPPWHRLLLACSTECRRGGEPVDLLRLGAGKLECVGLHFIDGRR